MATLMGQFDDAPEPIRELVKAAKSLGSGVTVLPSPSSLPKTPALAAAAARSKPKESAAVAWMHAEAEARDDGAWDGEASENGDFESDDELEAAMLGEGLRGGGGGLGLGSALERNLASGKMNFSQKASNEMAGARVRVWVSPLKLAYSL
jgi:hypothetical protein